MEIDKKSYKIAVKNRYNNKTVKSQIIIGTSLRKEHNHITRLKNREFGMSKRWSTYTISREGLIYQHYDDKYYSDFLGIKKGDINSISIILENMGVLFESSDGEFVNWINEKCEKDNVVKKEWQGFKYWERIPEEQIFSLIYLCNVLCDRHNIPKKFIEFNHYHKLINRFEGIVFKGNYVDDSSDTTPLIEINNLNKLINSNK